mgnify:FL=1
MNLQILFSPLFLSLIQVFDRISHAVFLSATSVPVFPFPQSLFAIFAQSNKRFVLFLTLKQSAVILAVCSADITDFLELNDRFFRSRLNSEHRMVFSCSFDFSLIGFSQIGISLFIFSMNIPLSCSMQFLLHQDLLNFRS